MDNTTDSRQQKFRDKMKTEGKKQRVFFLSDDAMDSIKNQKAKTNAPSLNHALESLLTNPTSDNQAIVEQAMIVGRVFKEWEEAPGNDTALPLRDEAARLSALTLKAD